jgi:hypothetical protein
LAGRPCLIIGVRECRHETGKFVRRASVEATSVVGDRDRVRRFRRIRSLRISGRPAQTAGPHWRELAGKPQHRIPTLGGRSVPSPGSFRTSIEWPCPSRPCWIDSPAGFPESGRDIAGVAGTTLRLRDCPGASCLGITTTPLAPRTRKALVSKQPGPSRISYFALPALAFGQPARQALTA